MTQQTPSTGDMPDPQEVSQAINEFAEQSQRIVQAFFERQTSGDTFQVPDPQVVAKAFFEMTTRMATDPAKLVEAQMRFWQDSANLWQAQMKRLMGETAGPVIEPSRDDKRFKDDAWSNEMVFDYVKQSYLLASRYVRESVAGVDGLDEKTRQKVDFYTRQFIDAAAPTNFAATNPTVLKATVDSKGENLLKGLKNLLGDLERGKGQLQISMTDTKAFEVGKNIATTPGKVVYENEMMQLIQYTPSTEEVYKRPLLIVPPWINKFYILDLREKNSFIKWAVDQGYTLFVISWVNPDEKLAEKSFEDYMIAGPLAAMDAIEQATGETEINMIGYCLGGTLTACTLAYLSANGDDRVKSATFFTTMTDFSEPGELSIFIDEEQLQLIEEAMDKKGYLEGRHMAQVFNMMRANDLIWSFVVNNYLLGKDPFPFDLLYWNGDSTRMPKMMHSFYLRNMYQNNLLAQPGGIKLCGVPIDLGAIEIPVMFVSTKEDHIAPWRGTYNGARLFGGKVDFVLAGSGHIAGIVNPASSKKYGFQTNAKLPETADAYLESAKQHEGSWWPHWDAWLKRKSGKKVPARTPGDGELPAIEDAPGRYVKVRSEG